jgi:HK97 family phage major capsid protein
MADDIKNDDGILEKEVAEQVVKEIKEIGESVEGIKKQQDEVNKSWKSLKDELETEKQDKTKVAKLQEDILTRQDALDKNFVDTSKRLDDIEVSLKRPGGTQEKASEADLKEAMSHYINCKAVKGDGGINYKEVRNLNLDVKEVETYKKAFESYLRCDEKLVTPEEYKTLSVGVDPHGGYTVTPFMASQILTRLYETDPIRQLAQAMTISTDSVEWLVDRDEVNVGWIGETHAPTETSTPDLQRKRIPVHELYAEPSSTQQLLEDSAINIESWLSNKVGDKMGRTEAAAFVTGDGIGKPRGFLTYANGTTWGTIEQIASVAAVGNIAADDFVNLKYSLREEYLNTGTFLMNRLTVRNVMLLKDGTGNYIWKPSMIAGDPSSLILGLPVRMSTTMPQVATGALSVALSDFRQTYMIVDRLGITLLRDPYTNKPFVKFYFRKRVGGDVINYDSIKILAIN